jgi:1-acyl-sn-glycerol-3-phosphate acyltransferase
VLAEPTPQELVYGSAALARRQGVGRLAGRALGRVTVRGLDQVPPAGPLVLVMNHCSWVDGPLLFGHVRRPISFLVKAEAFTPVLTPVLRGCGPVPVVRNTVDRAAVRRCIWLLRRGAAIGVFPEGSRGDGRVGATRPGAAYFALRSGAAVLPVAGHGTAGLTHRRTLHRPVAGLVIGTAIPVVRWPDERPLNRRVVAELAERLRAVLADLVAASEPGTGGVEQGAW